MSFQVYAHIAYTVLMLGGGGYLGYRYGTKLYSKAEALKTAVKQ